MTASARHLAAFNIGILKYDWDDPRVADFLNNLDRVYALAARSPGYVWHMAPEAMEAAQLDPRGSLGANPRTASTLSVWKDASSLVSFAFGTIHKRFYDRKNEWYDDAEQAWDGLRLVMWWVPQHHRPRISEAVERLTHLMDHGDSDHAFGWAHTGGVNLWRSRQCGDAA